MVIPHRPETPQRIVVKCAEARSRSRSGHVHCIFCGAVLAHDRRDRDPWCSCHHRHRIGALDLRVIWVLSACWPRAVNVSRALDADKDAVHRAVRRWRERGVTIRGLRSVGYRLGE